MLISIIRQLLNLISDKDINYYEDYLSKNFCLICLQDSGFKSTKVERSPASFPSQHAINIAICAACFIVNFTIYMGTNSNGIFILHITCYCNVWMQRKLLRSRNVRNKSQEDQTYQDIYDLNNDVFLGRNLSRLNRYWLEQSRSNGTW